MSLRNHEGRHARRHGGLPNRSRSQDIDDEHHEEKIPREFFCPISKKFMCDPVKIPGSRLTYDRDSVKHRYRPANMVPDLRTRKIMDVWFSKYQNDPPFDNISTRGFLVGSAISIVRQRRESLLREFARAIKYKPCLLKNGGGMWCVATLLSCPRPSVSWVSTALSIVAHIDKDENLLVPAGIDIGIHPDYSLLQPIKEALVYDEHESVLCEDFKPGFTNFIHGLIMNCPDILSLEGKMGVVVETLVRNMWPVPESFEFSWYLRQLLTLERLSESAECRGRMFQSGIIWMLLLVMNSGVSSIERIQEADDLVPVSLAIGTSMKILERLCHHSPLARRQLMEKVLSELKMFCESLFNHLKVVGDYVEGSDFLAQFLGEPGKPFRICIDLLLQDLPQLNFIDDTADFKDNEDDD